MPFKRRKNQNKKPETKPVRNPKRKLAPGHKKFGLGFDPDRVLEIGDSLPSEWNFYPDGRVRISDQHWIKAKVGKTIVSFRKDQTSLGGYIPSRVENCLFPNGERGLAIAGSYPDDFNKIVWRRPTSDRGHWWPGFVKFTPDDAVFSDYGKLLPIDPITKDEVGSEMPENMTPWTEFFNACTKSEILKTKLLIDTYAWGFRGLFIDFDFVYKPTGAEIYYSSERILGEMLARLRGCGEKYTDFYFGHPDGLGPQPKSNEANELLEIFDKLGFVPNN